MNYCALSYVIIGADFDLYGTKIVYLDSIWDHLLSFLLPPPPKKKTLNVGTKIIIAEDASGPSNFVSMISVQATSTACYWNLI